MDYVYLHPENNYWYSLLGLEYQIEIPKYKPGKFLTGQNSHILMQNLEISDDGKR
jgi:hypothetical protein